MISTLQAPATQATDQFASSYVANVDLTVILDYVREKQPELNTQLPKFERQYRKYMFLIGTGLFPNMSVPSKGVDQIWHAHILHTALYADFCQNVAGHFIHHNPYDKRVSLEARQTASLSLINASSSVFGKNVFKGKGSTDCGYCGGCSSCSGDCGGASCGQGAVSPKAELVAAVCDCGPSCTSDCGVDSGCTTSDCGGVTCGKIEVSPKASLATQNGDCGACNCIGSGGDGDGTCGCC